jgi:cytochrome P450
LCQAQKQWTEFLEQTVSARREEVKRLGDKFQRNDLLSRLMTASDDKYKSFDDQEVLSDSSVFMMAGTFTEQRV